ncbi:MAG TPA: tRNA-binding protein [Stellaceae bacterium]|jgi:tRNA-binding protein|nr:tRNA-binding protein [Stellaceae bacterium]
MSDMPPSVPEPKPSIVYDDFAKVDMRVGRVLEVQPFARARNPSYKVQVDLGPLGTRWSSAQVTSYAPEDLVGSLVICVVNFPPRNIAGFQSEVLILGAADAAGQVKVLGVRGEVAPGMPIY